MSGLPIALSLHFLNASEPSMTAKQEPSVCLQKLYPCQAEVALSEVALNADICVCVDGYTNPIYGPSCNREDSFSSRRGWQHAIKMTDSGCLFYSRTVPTQEINWSFSHDFSPVSTSEVMQGRRGEIGAYLLRRSSSCSLGVDGGAGEQWLYKTCLA